MNFVLFGHFIGSMAFTDMTDINLKDMLFNQQMKAIYDDILPLGIIDNGLEHEVAAIDPGKGNWSIELGKIYLEGGMGGKSIYPCP